MIEGRKMMTLGDRGDDGRKVRLALAGLLMISASSAALAQSGPAGAAAVAGANDVKNTDRTQLEEIVVTANKRQETLLRAPVAVSALPMITLQKAGVVGIQDLNSIAPNTQVRTIGADNGLQFSIRGVSNSDFNDTANPAVGTYIDGVYVGRTQGLAGALYDLERIEVLRGPQGTLYGRNSTGGNVNILTATPKQQFGASADLSYGNYNDIRLNAMVNVPVSENLAVRAAITYHRNDGYIRTMGNTLNRYAKADEYAGRVTALWKPSYMLSWRLSIDNYTSHGTPGLDQVTAPNGKPASGTPYNQPVSGVQEPALFVNNLMIRSRVDLKLSDTLSLAYIAGYQHVKDKPQTVLVNSPFFRNTPSKTYNQEVNLNFDSGIFQNIVGASYLHQKFFSRGGADFIFNSPADFVFLAHGDATTEAWGIFDQLTVKVADGLKLTGGGRYSSETFTEKDNQFTTCPLTLYPPAQFPIRTLLPRQFTLPGCASVGGLSGATTDGRVKSSKWTYRAGLEYEVSNSTSSYATVTTGFKAGGLNLGTTVPASDFTYNPENVTNYELGVKTRLLGNSLGFNVALFYTTYKDIQVTQLSLTGLANVTTNAAGARMYGAEIEGQWQITGNDRFNGFFNYLNATYTNYRNAVDEQTGAMVPSLNGNYQPYAARFSARGQYFHDFDLASGAKITAMGAIYWQTKTYLRAFNLPIDRVPSYTKSDLELSYSDPTDRFTASAFVHNLENKAIRNGGYAFVGSYLSSYSPPRTYGVRIGYKY